MTLQKLLTIVTLTAASMPVAVHAIIVEAGFPSADPSANTGAQLSGLGAAAPYGSLDASNVGFIAWEKFSAGTFSNQAVQYSGDSGILSGLLSQSATGPGLSTSGSNPGLISVDGVSYYGRLTTGAYVFTLEATATEAVSSVTLQLKHSNFLDADFNAITAFTATLDGAASEPLVEGSSLSNFSDALGLSTTSRVYSYTWNDLDIAAGETFTLNFSSGEDQTGFGFSVDSIALSVQTVPEPGVSALLGAGALALFWRNGRKKRHQ